ncbi:hypothetical protein AMJ80_04820 [bacterium SM23_31]|nr:MAG: hypothetical protein AMJ80_04820 [bacterium SM23_31]
MKFDRLLIKLLALSFSILSYGITEAQQSTNVMSKKERIIAYQIPEDSLKSISTQELLERCMNFPYLIDIYLVEDISLIFPYIIKSFNGFVEFFSSREDAGVVILNAYQNIQPDIIATKSTIVEKYYAAFRFDCISLFLAQEEILNQLKGSEKIAIRALLQKNDQMDNYNYNSGEIIYDIFSKNFISYALAKYLQKSGSISFTTLKNNNSEINESLSHFRIRALGENSIKEIKNIAINYIKN